MSNEPNDHNWEHRGLGPPPKNGRWDSWIKGILSFFCGILSAAFLLGGKSHDLDDLLKWKGNTSDEFKNVYSRLDRMEREGTSRSHWTDDAQSASISANSQRISEIERKSEQRGEAINVIQGKIERIESEIKDIKERLPK